MAVRCNRFRWVPMVQSSEFHSSCPSATEWQISVNNNAIIICVKEHQAKRPQQIQIWITDINSRQRIQMNENALAVMNSSNVWFEYHHEQRNVVLADLQKDDRYGDTILGWQRKSTRLWIGRQCSSSFSTCRRIAYSGWYWWRPVGRQHWDAF